MRRRKCHRKIKVSASLVQTTFRWEECGCSFGSGKPDLQDDGFVFRIRRLGMEEFCVEYDPWCCDDKGITFLWDSALYDLPYGRYEGVLFYEDEPCLDVELEIKKLVSVTSRNMEHKYENENAC